MPFDQYKKEKQLFFYHESKMLGPLKAFAIFFFAQEIRHNDEKAVINLDHFNRLIYQYENHGIVSEKNQSFIRVSALTPSIDNFIGSESDKKMAVELKEFIDGHVFDFSEVCKTYESNPKDVSDHFPVFASFGVEENKKVERVAAK